MSIDDQIKAVDREIAMRCSAYPRFVARKKMKQEKADHEIEAMRSVMATLLAVRAATQ